VSTRNNTLEPFYREKLFVSIKDSLAHRKTALEDATALTDTVLAAVLRQKQATIQVSQLISIVQEILQRFDPTAAAVYKAKHAKG
jgi:transcriptional regulator NrdR family protein